MPHMKHGLFRSLRKKGARQIEGVRGPWDRSDWENVNSFVCFRDGEKDTEVI